VQRHDFAYDLPSELIAQTPLAERSASRLLVLNDADPLPETSIGDADQAAQRTGDIPRAAAGGLSTAKGSSAAVAVTAARASTATGGASLRDCTMRDFPTLLRPKDLLVFNDTKVVAARLAGTKPSGGRVEIFLERVVAEAENEALVQLRASKPIREGLEVTTVGGIVRVLGRQGDLYRVGFPGSALEFFEKWGVVPLPPYIQRTPDASDRERYQSIFARERGAVAAPTASLHFDSDLIRRIEEMGVSRAFVTLHVGAGTFQPLRIDDLDAHVMHAERVTVSAATCAAIKKTRAEGGRVIAVGTTVIRALESAALVHSQSISPSQFSEATAAASESQAQDPAAVQAQSGRLPPGASSNLQTAEPTSSPVPSTSEARFSCPLPSTSEPRSGSPLPPAGWSGETRLFIRPGFHFQVADALLTNFHLPESTLFMLVCAFAGMTPVMQAYEHAVHEKYRFFSYGDAMFLTRKTG
jgi:S-adenosylmethionine:tRNA ribosyltransferase-isomerase